MNETTLKKKGKNGGNLRSFRAKKRGKVKTVAISDDWIAYVARDIAKALGSEMIAKIALSMRPVATLVEVIQDGLKNSLGESLTKMTTRYGFCVCFPPDNAVPQVVSPRNLHPPTFSTNMKALSPCSPIQLRTSVEISITTFST